MKKIIMRGYCCSRYFNGIMPKEVRRAKKAGKRIARQRLKENGNGVKWEGAIVSIYWNEAIGWYPSVYIYGTEKERENKVGTYCGHSSYESRRYDRFGREVK